MGGTTQQLKEQAAQAKRETDLARIHLIAHMQLEIDACHRLISDQASEIEILRMAVASVRQVQS